MFKQISILATLCIVVILHTNCDNQSTSTLQPTIDVNRILTNHQRSDKSSEAPSIHQGKAFMMPSNHGEVYVRVEGEGSTEFTLQGGDQGKGKRLFEKTKVIENVTIINAEYEVIIIDHDTSAGYVLATEGEPISALEKEFAQEVELTRFTGWGIIETNYLYDVLFNNNDKNDMADPWGPDFDDCCDGPIVDNLSCKCIKQLGAAGSGCEGGGPDAGECGATSSDGRSCSVSKCKGRTFPCCNA